MNKRGRLSILGELFTQDVLDYRVASCRRDKQRTKTAGNVLLSVRRRGMEHLIELIVCSFMHTSTGANPVINLESFLHGATLAGRVTTGRNDRLIRYAREIFYKGRSLAWLENRITGELYRYGITKPIAARVVIVNGVTTIQLS